MNRLVYGCIVGLAVLSAGCRYRHRVRAARRRSSKRRSTERRCLTSSRGTGCRWCSCTVRSPTIGPGTRSAIRPHGSTATSPLTSAISDPRPGRTRQALLGRRPCERPCGVPPPARRRPGTSRRLVVWRGRSARARGAARRARQESVPIRARNGLVRHRAGRSQAVNEDGKKMLAGGIAAVRARDEVAAVRALLDGVDALPGTFDAYPRAPRSVALENARTLPLAFAAPRLPRSLRAAGRDQGAHRRGARRMRPFFRIIADTASHCIPGSRLMSCPIRAIYGRRRIRPRSTARFWASWPLRRHESSRPTRRPTCWIQARYKDCGRSCAAS